MDNAATDDQALEVDVSCHRCGYNLRGLSELGRCPECGTVISESIRSDWLAFADPNWLSKLVGGTRIIIWGAVAAVILWLAASTIDISIHLLSLLLMIIAAVLPAILCSYGTWSFTAVEPGGMPHPRRGPWRRFTRAALIGWLIFGVLDILIESRWGEAGRAAMAAGVMVLFIQMAGQVCELFYVSELAERFPNDVMARQARFVAWGLGIASVCFIAADLYAALRRPLTGPPPPSGFVEGIGMVVLGLGGGVGMVIFFLWALVLLYRFGRAIRRLLSLTPPVLMPPPAMALPH